MSPNFALYCYGITKQNRLSAGHHHHHYSQYWIICFHSNLHRHVLKPSFPDHFAILDCLVNVFGEKICKWVKGDIGGHLVVKIQSAISDVSNLFKLFSHSSVVFIHTDTHTRRWYVFVVYNWYKYNTISFKFLLTWSPWTSTSCNDHCRLIFIRALKIHNRSDPKSTCQELKNMRMWSGVLFPNENSDQKHKIKTACPRILRFILLFHFLDR